jgi:triacylglycerol lipase
MTTTLTRRLLLALGAAVLAVGCTTGPTLTEAPPIVFVHGNGDSAGSWQTTIWRFESNGWPRERLHAIHLPYPLARDDDSRPQPGRTSTADHMAFLKAEVDRVLAPGVGAGAGLLTVTAAARAAPMGSRVEPGMTTPAGAAG